MLENIDLTQKLDKETYKKRIDDLAERLYYVQRKTWEAGIPVIILFEGWDAAGKGTTIHKLTDPIDPRGYKIYPIRASRTYEKKRPWLWRFWLKIPARGEWAIFDRSWYGRVLVERMEKLVPKDEWERAYRDIVDFERTLADDGTLIIKFFLHISKKEQNKRFRKLEKDKLNAWRVTAEDWANHKRYDKWRLVYEEMLERTASEWAPWMIVAATDKRFTRVRVYETIINALEERLGIIPGLDLDQAPVNPTSPEELAQRAAQEDLVPHKEQASPENQVAPEGQAAAVDQAAAPVDQAAVEVAQEEGIQPVDLTALENHPPADQAVPEEAQIETLPEADPQPPSPSERFAHAEDVRRAEDNWPSVLDNAAPENGAARRGAVADADENDQSDNPESEESDEEAPNA